MLLRNKNEWRNIPLSVRSPQTMFNIFDRHNRVAHRRLSVLRIIYFYNCHHQKQYLLWLQQLALLLLRLRQLLQAREGPEQRLLGWEGDQSTKQPKVYNRLRKQQGLGPNTQNLKSGFMWVLDLEVSSSGKKLFDWSNHSKTCGDLYNENSVYKLLVSKANGLDHLNNELKVRYSGHENHATYF